MDKATTFQISRRGNPERWNVLPILKTTPQLEVDTGFAAGTLTFDLIEVQDWFTPQNGDEVRFSWNGVKVFFGHIFKVSYSGDEVFSVTAYDNMRYLKNQDSIIWPAGTASQRFETMCKAAGIPYRVVTRSSYKLPAKVADGETYFDMIKADIDDTATATGKRYFLRDNDGTVEFLAMPSAKSNIIVGDKSLLTDWKYDASIDDAANVVKVVKKSKKDEGKTTATARDSSSGDDPANTTLTTKSSSGSTVSKWGKLQVVEKVNDDKMNAAAMQQKAKDILREKNKEERTLELTALGTTDLRAGDSCYIKVQSLTDIGIGPRQVNITKLTHKFDPKNWTMDLEVSI